MMKRKLSDILEMAAGSHLRWPGDTNTKNRSRFSCCAVTFAFDKICQPGDDVDENKLFETRAFKFLTSLGLPSCSSNHFSDLETDDGIMSLESQGARYMWLKLAALVARDLDL